MVLIREAELVLAPGLNAITGETGAGKTILAQALGLLLGAKGDDSYVGAAGEEAYVEAELDLGDELEELAELRPEDEDALVVSRRVFADGRTRAYAWGRAAAREDVAAAVERVVAMSGQFEQRRLARRYEAGPSTGAWGDKPRLDLIILSHSPRVPGPDPASYEKVFENASFEVWRPRPATKASGSG